KYTKNGVLFQVLFRNYPAYRSLRSEYLFSKFNLFAMTQYILKTLTMRINGSWFIKPLGNISHLQTAHLGVALRFSALRSNVAATVRLEAGFWPARLFAFL
ncbi:MAG: hypothetical protein AABY76_09145, partial [Planctomycetota bacterium]